MRKNEFVKGGGISEGIKISFFDLCSKMQIIPINNFNIKTCFIQFLLFFRLKSCFKGQILSSIYLSLPKAYTLMCFDRNINGNRDVNRECVRAGAAGA